MSQGCFSSCLVKAKTFQSPSNLNSWHKTVIVWKLWLFSFVNLIPDWVTQFIYLLFRHRWLFSCLKYPSYKLQFQFQFQKCQFQLFFLNIRDGERRFLGFLLDSLNLRCLDYSAAIQELLRFLGIGTKQVPLFRWSYLLNIGNWIFWKQNM